MRTPLRPNGTKQQTAQTVILPAPFRGLNRRDQLQDTDFGYATSLENFIPTQSEVVLRKGYQTHATGLPDLPVESLMEYASGDRRKLFAATGSEVYDVSSSGKVPGPALTNLANAQWQHTMFATTSGQYLVCVNGADGVKTFNGTDWDSPAITGTIAERFKNMTAHKGRLWFVEKNTLNAWYLPTFAIAGQASRLNLGALCKKGGKLQALSSWTLDAGDGADDYLVCVTSEGECVVYAGTDPDFANAWSLVGIYQTDRPVGLRCLVKFGADLLILTESGIISLTALLRSQNRLSSLSELVREDFLTQASVTRNNSAWQLIHYHKKGWLMVNMPTQNNKAIQYIYNSLIPPPNGWCSFSGMNAFCWSTFKGDLFFGLNGKVCKADTGQRDDDMGINGTIHWSWSKMGTSQKKRFTLARLHMRSDHKPDIRLALSLDYKRRSEETSPTIASHQVKAAEWDKALWDQKLWAGLPEAFSQWVSLSGLGHSASLRLSAHSFVGSLSVIGSEIIFEPGGIL